MLYWEHRCHPFCTLALFSCPFFKLRASLSCFYWGHHQYAFCTQWHNVSCFLYPECHCHTFCTEGTFILPSVLRAPLSCLQFPRAQLSCLLHWGHHYFAFCTKGTHFMPFVLRAPLSFLLYQGYHYHAFCTEGTIVMPVVPRVPLSCLLTPLLCLLYWGHLWHDLFTAKHCKCREVGWEVEGSRLEAWMKSHKSEVAIT